MLKSNQLPQLALILFFLAFTSCSKPTITDDFELLDGDQTGLSFSNDLELTTEMNIFKYMYFYNGGGLGSGDLNNDGLIDLFFTANMKDNKLFINKGNLKFEDVTDQTNIKGDLGWSNGVSIVDINNDGMLDIYISQVGDFLMFKGHNLLYVCKKIDANGIPVYEEKSKEYNLDLIGFGTQAVFFDYDLDGDLDMYQLNHSLHANGTFGERKSFEGTYHDRSGDRLMRNDNGHFTDVTKTSGIYSTVIGYGLGVIASDINFDGYPDLYIGNDFHENDYYYVNQKDGTFKEVLTEQMMHTSRFSMGVDAADLNNDGYNEIISLDMLPEDPFILKKSEGEDAIGIFNFKLGYGYNYQYARNCLQLNNSNNTFSEIGAYCGVHATDWSWSPLFFDFNNDGKKDLFISNGIPKRMNDIDYINFVSDPNWQWKTKMGDLSKEDLSIVKKMPEIKIKNKFFLQDTSLLFKDIKTKIKNDMVSYSNSAIYADLDNDGDVDIVTNNINEKPFIYKNNHSNHISKDVKCDLIELQLEGDVNNLKAIGAKVISSSGSQKEYYENIAVRGFQSSMINPIYVSGNPDSIAIIWPDNTYEVVKSFMAEGKGSKIKIKYKSGLPTYIYSSPARPNISLNFNDITKKSGLNYIHKENSYVEFDREPLIPHSCGEEGPAIAIGDVNGDGTDDIYFGSSKTFHSALYTQGKNGLFKFSQQADLYLDSMFEEVDAQFIDVDLDGDLDLLVASGGNEFRLENEHNAPRLFINDSKGNFTLKKDAFSGVYATASCIRTSDFNGDGFMDLYLGARSQPWSYGEVPNSFLLQNDGTGRFTDVTNSRSNEIKSLGMIKDALWLDMDKDGKEDLIVAVEWDGIYCFKNMGSSFEKIKLTDKHGLWNFITPIDIDGDGDQDLVVGNYSENNRLKPTVSQPLRMYYGDFDSNGTKEQVVTYYTDNIETVFSNKVELEKQIPYIKKKYLMAVDFAKASVTELFSKEKLNKAKVYTSDYLDNAFLYNEGNFNFKLISLPKEFQISPYKTACTLDLNNDNRLDLILGGNFYGANIQMGRYDGDFGSILLNNSNGKFDKTEIPNQVIKGEIKHIKLLQVGHKDAVLIVRNNDSPILLELDKKNNKSN